MYKVENEELESATKLEEKEGATKMDQLVFLTVSWWSSKSLMHSARHEIEGEADTEADV